MDYRFPVKVVLELFLSVNAIGGKCMSDELGSNPIEVDVMDGRRSGKREDREEPASKHYIALQHYIQPGCGELVSRNQILRREQLGQGKVCFPVQLTTSRFDNHIIG